MKPITVIYECETTEDAKKLQKTTIDSINERSARGEPFYHTDCSIVGAEFKSVMQVDDADFEEFFGSLLEEFAEDIIYATRATGKWGLIRIKVKGEVIV